MCALPVYFYFIFFSFCWKVIKIEISYLIWVITENDHTYWRIKDGLFGKVHFILKFSLFVCYFLFKTDMRIYFSFNQFKTGGDIHNSMIYTSKLNICITSVFKIKSTNSCMYNQFKKKKKKLLNFNTNYRREVKLVLINMDHCGLQFDVLNFFLGIRLQWGGGFYLTLIFVLCKPPNLTTKSSSLPLKSPAYKFSQLFWH